jgi:hypothetical protein
MPEQEPTIAQLEARLDALVRTQIDFQKEITAIRAEITRLRARTAGAERSTQSSYVPRPPSDSKPIPPAAPPGQPPNPDRTTRTLPHISKDRTGERAPIPERGRCTKLSLISL